MLSSNSSTVERGRQYRPTYSLLPKTVEPSNFGAPLSAPIQAVMRDSRRTSLQGFGRSEINLHSEPTVATSGLTVSASTNDLVFPGKFIHSANRLNAPTRIPTPMGFARVVTRPRLSSVSVIHCTNSDSDDFDDFGQETPRPKATPSKNPFLVNGEEFQQVWPRDQGDTSRNISKTNRLLEPIHPDPAPVPSMSRARTMNVLTTITNSFTRPNIRKTSPRVPPSTNSTSTRASSGPAAFFSRNSRPNSPSPQGPAAPKEADLYCDRSGMSHAYWAGRYLALSDRLRGEVFGPDLLNPNPDPTEAFHALKEMERTNDRPENDVAMSMKDEQRAHRVFVELGSHCKTNDAKKSLWGFQQAYARSIKCARLLPLGGTMEEKENMLARAGKFFIKSRASDGLGEKKSEKKTEGGKVEGKKVEDKKKAGKKAVWRSLDITDAHQHDVSPEVRASLMQQNFSWGPGGVKL